MSPSDEIRGLLASDTQQVVIGPHDEPPRLLFPGAFNPLHQGHRQMARIAAEWIGSAANFELSVDNVDKPSLTEHEIESRLAQFAINETVRLTRRATFAQKAELFPGITFIVGVDTVKRISSVKYYGGSEPARTTAIETIVANRCRLLVFGRLLNGRFHSLADLAVERSLLDISDGVPEHVFRADISSTGLRYEE